MRSSPKRKPRPPLDAAKLDELALAYVGRFATTRAKLRSYLERKVRERGWAGGTAPDSPDPVAVAEAIAERFAASGYVDDAAFALAKSRALTGRGYGLRRVDQSLRVAGVDDRDAAPARAQARADSVEAALHFAERRRLGPFAGATPDRQARERGLATMIRAGHPFGLARAIVDLPPGAKIDVAELAEKG
jgi:regulatory protein